MIQVRPRDLSKTTFSFPVTMSFDTFKYIKKQQPSLPQSSSLSAQLAATTPPSTTTSHNTKGHRSHDVL
ncbi:hypothetical protein C1H46_008389 [Malus baccata]|uniref:Uncharacterized protein n=1 Tax=Malus baccata TaxID=106549 RepID=A0A540N4J8_MALBA|nr:hypothetical protein C1H46_008389 [Malus baccata]